MQEAEDNGPYFLIHVRTPAEVQRGFGPLPFADLEAAYCDVCAALPALTAEISAAGIDPVRCSCLICDLDDMVLMEVPFTEGLAQAPSPPSAPSRRSEPESPLLARAAQLRQASEEVRARSLQAILRSQNLRLG